MHQRGLSLPKLVLAGLLLACAGGAAATSYTFPGKLPPGCSGAKGGNGSYSCGDLTLEDTDSISLGAPKPVTITVNGGMKTGSANNINAAGAAADLNLIVSGKLELGYKTNITANISAGSVKDADGQIVITGNLATSTGAVELIYGSTVSGSITSTSGSIALGNAGRVNGSISSDSGAVSVDYGGTVQGSISTSGAVSLANSAVVGGNVVGGSGNVNLVYGAKVGGGISTRTGAITLDQATTVSACVKSTASASISLGYQAVVGGVCCGSSCGNACVVNNSSYSMPAACLPSPVLSYLFNESVWSGQANEVKDSSGNGFDATASGLAGSTATTSSSSPAVAGSSGSCGYGVFKRSSKDYVAVPTSFPNAGPKDSFTLTAWIRSTDSALPNQRILIDDENNTKGYGLDLGSGGAGVLRFYARGVATSSWPSSAAVVSSNTWTFVAVSVDADTKTMTLLVYDTTGRLLASVSKTYAESSLGSDNGRLSIGGETNAASSGEASNAYGFSGNLDEVRIYAQALSASQIAQVQALTSVCSNASAPDHYELSLPTSSLSCQSSTVTVTACASSATPCTSAYSGAVGSTASLSTSGAVLGAKTLSFNAAGQASTTLSYPGAADGSVVSVALAGESLAATGARRCCPDGASCTAANSCSTTFKSAGFVIAASANASSTASLPSQTAGTTSATYYLRAVQTNTTTQACEAALSGAATVNWAQQCVNPGTCSGSPLMTVTGSSATLVNNNPATSVTSYSAVPMVFDSRGNAPFSLSYGDAGQVRLWVSKTVNSAALTGSSNAFVSKPASLGLSGLRQTTSPARVNPAAASASGAKFIRAGESFSAELSALSSGGAVTPNFGREATPESVLLTPSLVLPVGGVLGTLAGASVAGASFVNGVASISNLSYSEVGIITLTPSLADGDYLGAGAVTGSTTGSIGRFVPDHFALTPGTPSPACSALFSYFGQDGLATPFTLTAQNQANATTRNYSGSLAKLDLGAWANFGFTASGLPGGSTLAASATAPSGSWLAGVAGVSARHQFSRPASASAQAAVTVSAAPVDSDGVTLGAATAVGAATPLRYGRLRLSNAFGSAKSALQLPVTAEYWSGNSWVLNSADSCTTLAAANVVLSNPRDASGNASSATSSAGAVTLASGTGLLTLAAPSPAGSSLSLDLALNLGSSSIDQSCQGRHPASLGAAKPWLRGQNGSCALGTDSDPAARASFGIYSPESRKTVHVRDIF